MFRSMRRHPQQLSHEECEAILRRNTSGVLSLMGDDGYPYGVPMCHFYDDGKIYFHCAKTGHKMDAVRTCSRASFCVVDQDEPREKELTTFYRSAIAFGQIRELNQEEIIPALGKLTSRFFPLPEGWESRYANSISAVAMLVLDIEHMTAKESIELVRGRKGNA